jgi:hypothetical protein
MWIQINCNVLRKAQLEYQPFLSIKPLKIARLFLAFAILVRVRKKLGL